MPPDPSFSNRRSFGGDVRPQQRVVSTPCPPSFDPGKGCLSEGEVNAVATVLLKAHSDLINQRPLTPRLLMHMVGGLGLDHPGIAPLQADFQTRYSGNLNVSLDPRIAVYHLREIAARLLHPSGVTVDFGSCEPRSNFAREFSLGKVDYGTFTAERYLSGLTHWSVAVEATVGTKHRWNWDSIAFVDPKASSDDWRKLASDLSKEAKFSSNPYAAAVRRLLNVSDNSLSRIEDAGCVLDRATEVRRVRDKIYTAAMGTPDPHEHCIVQTIVVPGGPVHRILSDATRTNDRELLTSVVPRVSANLGGIVDAMEICRVQFRDPEKALLCAFLALYRDYKEVERAESWAARGEVQQFKALAGSARLDFLASFATIDLLKVHATCLVLPHLFAADSTAADCYAVLEKAWTSSFFSDETRLRLLSMRLKQ